jgi:hypothetical protein
MRRLLLATTASLAFASAATAGGLAEPITEPEVIVEDTSTSNGGLLVPLLLLVLIAAAVASSGEEEAATAASDIRLKTDVAAVGMTPHGLPLYRFRYKGLPTVYEGVMAQDVARTRPDAIVMMPFGYMAVDYDKLGLKMKTIH